MSTEREFAELVLAVLQPENVRVRPMFGEYCLYHNNKPVGFLCDDRVLLKPTDPPVESVLELEEAEAYPGSKMYRVVPNDRLDSPWFRETILEMSAILPTPKAKKKKPSTD